MTRRRAVLAPLAVATALAACASGPPGKTEPVRCEQLAGTVVPATVIGLPTGGARVTSAKVVAAGGTAPKTVGEHCLVAAEIDPVDPAAPVIRLQVALPAEWNHRALMLGGGGYDGTVPNVVGNVSAGPVDVPNPVGRGYAVFGSDSGHAGASNQGAFGMNDEAVRNFSFEALKKTRDTALALIARRYGEGPERRYFAGGSTGGREALAVVQKWPADFDGAIALYPAWNAASLDLQFGRIARALAKPGAFANLAKRKALYDAVMQTCDAADGVVDGLVGNQADCNTRFDPATAQSNGRALRCAGGADTGDDCLSDAQIAGFRVIDTPIVFGAPVASGETGYPGFNAWGSDFGRPGTGVQTTVNFLGLNTAPPTSPMPAPPAIGAPGPGYGPVFWDQWVKYFVTRDPGFDALTLDPEKPGRWQSRISELTKLQDVNAVDLSPFASRGGKLLIAHGTADQLVSTRATEDYVGRVRAKMGTARADDFLRYYEIPGYNHAASTVFNAAWDSLAALEAWVERGVAPRDQRVVDTVGVPGRSRPLCDYPQWPRYLGTGDVNAAASFRCVGP